MVNRLFVLYNVLSQRYGDVLAYPTVGYALARCVERFKAAGLDQSEYELCEIGNIDIATGIITSLSGPIRHAWESTPSGVVE